MSRLLALLFLGLLCAGCSPRIDILGGLDPLQEQVLEGEAEPKVALVHIRGFISSSPEEDLLATRPGVVQEVVSRLRKISEDKKVGALVLVIDSPGGTATDSAILYHEISRCKEESGMPVVAAMLGVAASGGYMAALAADHIVAHSTTLTGSIGTIFLRPDISGLMNLVGVSAEVYKSGEFKDMGSPLRESTPTERELLQEIILEQNEQFLDLGCERRRLTREELAPAADARVLTGEQAQGLRLVDEIGFLENAVDKARKLAGLPKDAKLVVYRRQAYPDDTAYNTLSNRATDLRLHWAAEQFLPLPRTGLYHLWAPEY